MHKKIMSFEGDYQSYQGYQSCQSYQSYHYNRT